VEISAQKIYVFWSALVLLFPSVLWLPKVSADCAGLDPPKDSLLPFHYSSASSSGGPQSLAVEIRQMVAPLLNQSRTPPRQIRWIPRGRAAAQPRPPWHRDINLGFCPNSSVGVGR